jgi:hypothetical protein
VFSVEVILQSWQKKHQNYESAAAALALKTSKFVKVMLQPWR